MDANEREAFAAYAQLPQFERKVERSLEVIREALAIGPAYVAVSWGKDSVVMLHLCQQVQRDIEAFHLCVAHRHYFGNYDAVITQYKAKFGLNYHEVQLNHRNLIFGGSTADYLRTAANSKNCFIGLRKEESRSRKISLSKYGAIHQYQGGKEFRFCPIEHWNLQDIWAYHALHDLPHLDYYDHVAKTSKQSRTTALEGLRYRDKPWEQESREWLRNYSPQFKEWEPHGYIHVFVLLCLQTIESKDMSWANYESGVSQCLDLCNCNGATSAEMDLLKNLFQSGNTLDPFAVTLLDTLKRGASNAPSYMDS
jgi:phosphoadenosine phosphosulfate reductase